MPDDKVEQCSRNHSCIYPINRERSYLCMFICELLCRLRQKYWIGQNLRIGWVGREGQEGLGEKGRVGRLSEKDGWFSKKGWEGFGSSGEKGGIGLKGWDGLGENEWWFG